MFAKKFPCHPVVLFLIVFVSFVGTVARAATVALSAGQAFTVSVTANGTAPLSYQWYKDGAALTGVTGSSYSVSNVQAVNAGVYYAVVSNTAGSATSDNGTVTLVANTVPVVTTQPVSQTVTVGGSVTFTVAASGTPAPTFQWQKNGANITGATSASLNLTNVQSSDGGTYALVVTNSAGSAKSNGAVLTVTVPVALPVITTQPVSQTLPTGANATFTVMATGSGLTYQWQQNGVNFAYPNGTETTATFTNPNLWLADAGTYTCIVSNSAGSVTSAGAVLTVYVASTAPTLTTQPLGQTVTAGASVTFTAAASGTPTPTYQWTLNGTAIAGAASASLTMLNVQSANAGTYTVVATNVAGSATSSGAVLTVNPVSVVPAITTQPVSQTVTAGATVTFMVAASGTPAPAFQWRKNGTSISGATAASYTIASAAVSDAATYTVVATNVAGSATSSGAVLTVNPVSVTPAITTQPVNQVVNTGTSVTFTAAASGTPSPTYQWQKSRVNIIGATSASYTIASAVTGDAGSYSVVAANTAGSATSNSATLTINAATSAPAISSQPATQTVTSGSSVTFKVSASGSPTLTYQWRKNGSRIRGATASSYTITNVSSNNAGTFTVVVTNSYGSVASNGAVLSVKSTTSPAVYRVDFNGDGKSDLIWQNSTTGECSVWLMNGTTVGSVVSLGTVSTDQRICGTGDFNKDGKSDILWQNNTTGECSVWLMNGTTVGSKVSLGTVSLDWQMRGSGDFNGDGRSDIVWQNIVTGECSIWLMTGTTVSSIVSLGSVPTDLIITGTGDFNRDGQSDILWQNTETGEYGVWLMAGTTVSSNVTLGTVTLDWQMSGAGDFNANSQSDLLWQNLLTGECSVWLMSGTTVSSKVSLGTVSLDWILRN